MRLMTTVVKERKATWIYTLRIECYSKEEALKAFEDGNSVYLKVTGTQSQIIEISPTNEMGHNWDTIHDIIKNHWGTDDKNIEYYLSPSYRIKGERPVSLSYKHSAEKDSFGYLHTTHRDIEIRISWDYHPNHISARDCSVGTNDLIKELCSDVVTCHGVDGHLKLVELWNFRQKYPVIST